MENTESNWSQKNVVVHGLSGSGKDTVANYLEYNADYFKLRIAGTIKQIIQENRNMSAEELEEAKRFDPEIRQEHHDVGHYLDIKDATKNRVKLIISGKVNEIKYKKADQAIVVHDARGLEREISQFLDDDNWVCIFLSRNNYDKEFQNTNQWTEQGSIGETLKFIKDNNYFDKSIVIINDKVETELPEELNEIAEKCLGYFNISKDATEINLNAVIKHLLENELI